MTLPFLSRPADSVATGALKPLLSVLIALAVMVCVEVAAQFRSQIKLGQSIFNRVVGESNYAYDPNTGLRLLRPSTSFGGSQQSIRSNRYGLRSGELPVAKPAGNFRIAVVGASTVMGAYARDNKSTFPALLEKLLRQSLRSENVDVINAGVVGLTLSQQVILLERLVLKFTPDVIVVYPGFNDFDDYCERPRERLFQPEPIVEVALPKWLLSIELLRKNSSVLRQLNVPKADFKDPASIDLTAYKDTLQALFQVAHANRVPLVMATVARSFRRSQAPEVQAELSQSARYYTPCFDVAGLHTLHERHNELIATTAENAGVRTVRLDAAIPGGRMFFVDSSHFSARGENLAAKVLANELARYQLLPKGT